MKLSKVIKFLEEKIKNISGISRNINEYYIMNKDKVILGITRSSKNPDKHNIIVYKRDKRQKVGYFIYNGENTKIKNEVVMKLFLELDPNNGISEKEFFDEIESSKDFNPQLFIRNIKKDLKGIKIKYLNVEGKNFKIDADLTDCNCRLENVVRYINEYINVLLEKDIYPELEYSTYERYYKFSSKKID